MNDNINIVVTPCSQCDTPMTVLEARVEDDYKRGVIVVKCPKCGNEFSVIVEVSGE